MDEIAKQMEEDEEVFTLVREHLNSLDKHAADRASEELDDAERGVDLRRALSVSGKIVAGMLLLVFATRGILPVIPATLLIAHEIWSAWERGHLN